MAQLDPAGAPGGKNRRGLIALFTAWGLTLGLLGAGVAWLALTSPAPPAPPIPTLALALPAPPPSEPAPVAEEAGSETTVSPSPDPEETAGEPELPAPPPEAPELAAAVTDPATLPDDGPDTAPEPLPGTAAPAATAVLTPAPPPTARPAIEGTEDATPSPAQSEPAEAAATTDGVGEEEVEQAALPAPLRRPVADPDLLDNGNALGPLPRIGPDGRKPWQAYAAPFEAPATLPRIAVVIADMGLSSAATEAAIQTLPGPVTLAFSPYAARLGEWMRLARAAGHEVLLSVPMEPMEYPANDPGPHTLLTRLTPDQNQARLEWALSRVTGYVGVTNHMGSRLTIDSDTLRPILITLRDRGLMFLDSRSSARSLAARLAAEIGLPRAINDRFIDNRASRAAIDDRLGEIEAIARKEGFAVAMGFPYPVTLERLRAWVPTLEKKGFALAPITAVVNRQPTR